MALPHPRLDGMEVFNPGLMSLRFDRRVAMHYACGVHDDGTDHTGQETDPFCHARGHNISKGGHGGHSGRVPGGWPYCEPSPA